MAGRVAAASSFTASFGPRAVDRRWRSSAMVAGREPTADGHGAAELGDLPACRKGIDARRRRRLRDVAAAGRRARARRAGCAQYDVVLTPALAEAPRRCTARSTPARRRPDGRLHALGPLHAVHRGHERHRLAGDLAAAVPPRGRSACRSASSSSASPPARARCSRSPRSSRRARPWARPPRAASTVSTSRAAAGAPRAIARGLRRRGARRRRVPRAVTHRDLHQLGLVPGRGRARFISASTDAQRAEHDRRRNVHERPAAAARRAARARRSRCG